MTVKNYDNNIENGPYALTDLLKHVVELYDIDSSTVKAFFKIMSASYNQSIGADVVSDIAPALFNTNKVTLHSAAVADANGPAINCSKMNKASFQLIASGGASVFYIEISNDGGTTWSVLNYDAHNVDLSSGVSLSSAVKVVDVAGKWENIRCRLDWTSGTATAYFFGGN